MAALQNQELLRFAHAPLSHFFLSASASASAIRKASSPDEALRLFKLRFQRRRPGFDPFETHAAVFTLKASSSVPVVVPHLHAHFLKSGLFADVHVASALLHSYALSSFSLGRLLFDEMPNRNIVTANTMLTCYSRHGHLSEARSLFNSMKDKDSVSWSAMIGGYMDAGHRTHGLALFREMMKAGHPKPDPPMLVTLLSGCASTGSLRLLGKSIHAYAEKNGIEINVQLGTSLIDMYARSGCLMSAFCVFERMRERNVTHWTAMICGLAMHGHGKEAVAFFDRMRELGVRPNEITFTGVLSACCHAGLIEEGQRYFCSMVEEFGYKPQIHHYGCMVDLFAKAGRLEDAYAVIESMRMEPNIIVWTCFLAACKKYKNFEIAEKGIEKVLSMAIPNEDGGVYTLISDLYALGDRWNDVERVRKLMDEHSVKKSRGSSFIEVEEKRR